MRIGRISKLFSPGWSCCYRCHTTWRFVEGHSTMFSSSAGCFPLCQKCWQSLTPYQRLPFYRELWTQWNRDGTPHDWAPIEAAVLDGK